MSARSNQFLRQGAAVAGAGLVVAGLIFVAGRWVDGPVSTWVHGHGLDTAIANRRATAHTLSVIAKIPGEWYGALGTLVLVTAIESSRKAKATTHGRDAHATGMLSASSGTGSPPVRREVLFPLLVFSAALASSLNGIVKWIPGRQRPRRNGEYFGDYAELHWFRDGLHGLFNQSNLSFPSGHSCQAFALATALAILYPRAGWAAFVFAVITGTERVLSNSHYVSDVVGGAALGAGGAVAAWCILRGLAVRFSPPLSPPPPRD